MIVRRILLTIYCLLWTWPGVVVSMRLMLPVANWLRHQFYWDDDWLWLVIPGGAAAGAMLGYMLRNQRKLQWAALLSGGAIAAICLAFFIVIIRRGKPQDPNYANAAVVYLLLTFVWGTVAACYALGGVVGLVLTRRARPKRMTKSPAPS